MRCKCWWETVVSSSRWPLWDYEPGRTSIVDGRLFDHVIANILPHRIWSRHSYADPARVPEGRGPHEQSGLVLYARRAIGQRAKRTQVEQLGFLALCVASVVGTLGAMNYSSWRTRGVAGGIQGRYYLAALVPLTTLLTTGLVHLLPKRWRPIGHWLVCWGMILLNAVALLQVLLPRYYL